MIKTVVIFNCDNGYNCSCCRKEWNEIEERYFDDSYTEDEIKCYFYMEENEEKRVNSIYIINKKIF